MNHLWVQTLLDFIKPSVAVPIKLNVNVAMKKIYEV